MNTEQTKTEGTTGKVDTNIAALTQSKRYEPTPEPSDAPDNFFEGLDTAPAATDPDTDEDNIPAFDFAVTPVVKLKDGTEFHFKIPDLASERRADNLRKTLILTSPARVNGFNPTQETTDYATADWRYFLDNVTAIKGFALSADADPNEVLDARTVIRTETDDSGKERRITVADLVPVKHARAAVQRIFGGKIEVEKPETGKKILVLNEARYTTVKQDFGVEQNDDGTFATATNRTKFIFREAAAKELTFWQTKCFLGYKIPIKGGGAREERYFNTDKTVELFDKLIERIEGGTYHGEPLDANNSEHLARIPAGVKRTAITIAMGDASGDVGN